MLMSFDDPIYFDHEAMEELMADTDQHRICWMFHDALSDSRVAWMFDQYAGKRAPAQEHWTTMAWVAAGRLEHSCYLLFKWYSDFCSPPERSDLYYIEREEGPEGELRVRLINTDPLMRQLGPEEGQGLLEDFLGGVSDNATDFFGESSFEKSPVSHILQLIRENPGQELSTFDWYLGRQNDWDKAVQCAAISAYFSCLRCIREMIYNIVVTDGGDIDIHRVHTQDLLGILGHLSSGFMNNEQLGQLADLFRDLSDAFCLEPHYSHTLSPSAGRALFQGIENGSTTWVHLNGQGRQKLLRELYCACNPRQVWDVFHQWQGELYFTVFRRAPGQGLRRGIYLLSRFEDQQGMDITDLFFLENVTGGIIHLCKGDFFDELLDRLLDQTGQEVVLHGGRRRAYDAPAAYSHLLKDAFDSLELQSGQLVTAETERVYEG